MVNNGGNVANNANLLCLFCRISDSGQLYHYFSYGAACSDVEIDCLTGDHQVRTFTSGLEVSLSLLCSQPLLDLTSSCCLLNLRN